MTETATTGTVTIVIVTAMLGAGTIVMIGAGGIATMMTTTGGSFCH
ncbi:MAG TPA: hypothetical protein VGZ29_07260 [Terriglobia bacterium]|nr:hypothetical protein [Terriglobia bacterium]